MNFESDDECTADYGVFGDRACGCAICNPPPQKRDLRREQEAARWAGRMEQERQTSSNFNSHMIALFNAAQRKEPT